MSTALAPTPDGEDRSMAKSTKATAAAKTLTVEQYGSPIRRPGDQKKILTGLGLGRIGSSKTLPDNAATRGMIAKVAHMVRIVEA